MEVIAHIDKSIFSCISDKITTTDVIITDERIEHIKERHPNDYETYSQYIPSIIESPGYIIEEPKHPDSAVLMKEIVVAETRFQLVLRLVTSTEDEERKNSVITFLKISEKTWNKYLRNKKVLYKREQ